MKKIALGIMASVCLLSANYLGDKKVKELNNIEFFKKINAEVKSVYDAGSFYIVSIKPQQMQGVDTVFVTKDKKTLIKGYAVDLSNGLQIDAPVKDINIAKNKEAFSVGNGKDEYMLFTDVQCPYCKELEKYFPQLLDKVKINVFYFPMLQLHPEAGELSKYQMFLAKTESNKLKVLESSVNDEGYKNRNYEINLSNELDKKLKEQMNIGEEFGVQGTPTLITKEGKKINFMEFLSKYNITPTMR